MNTYINTHTHKNVHTHLYVITVSVYNAAYGLISKEMELHFASFVIKGIRAAFHLKGIYYFVV